MQVTFPPEYRTQNRGVRRFYAKYMTWLEKLGYVVVIAVIGGFVFAYNYPVDEIISADKVKVEFAAQSISFKEPFVVVRSFVKDKMPVRKGELLLEYVTGEADCQKASVRVLASANAAPADLPYIESHFPLPATQKVVAENDGVFTYDSKSIGLVLPKKSEFGKVQSTTDLVVSANLAGASVSKATQDGEVKITNFVVEPSAGIIVRQQGADNTTYLSGQILGDEVKTELDKVIKGTPFKVRDDISFTGDKVSEVQIEAKASPGSAETVACDPDPKMILTGKVLTGDHKADIQFADLSPELASKLKAIVGKSLGGKSLNSASGGFSPDSDYRFVLKVKSLPTVGQSEGALPATALSHVYEVTAKIDSPPDALIRAVKQAQENGKSVLARVELKTGTRRLATILLKKS